jgi:hypothetical protein
MKRALALLALAACTQLVQFEQIPERSAQCSDLVDNDGDELIDCADPDCARLPQCEGAALCRWEGVTHTITVPAPVALAAARIDGDARVDAVVASRGGELRELRNDGTRLVAQAPIAIAGATLAAVAAATVNGDQLTDLVAIDTAMPAAVRLLATTAGSFGPPARTTLPAGTSAIVVGDLDGDGHVDAFTSGSGDASFLRNDGRGVFTATTPSLPEQPRAIAAGDVNRDQRVDLVYATPTAGRLRVLLQGGTGAFPFTAGQPFAAGTAPAAVLIADLDATAGRDLVTADPGGDDLGVFVDEGAGTYRALARVALGADARALAAGDLDGDGHIDLVAAIPAGLVILRGNGVGRFDELPPRFAVTEVRALVLADLDGDGADDLIAAETDANRVTVALSRTTNCD